MTHFGFVVAAGLNGALGVTNLLEYASALLQVGRKAVFLLGDLGKQDTELVGDVRDGIVASFLTPVAELRRNVCLLLRGSLVGANAVVLGLDQSVELLGEVGLVNAAKGGHCEAVLGGLLGGIALLGLLGPD